LLSASNRANLTNENHSTIEVQKMKKTNIVAVLAAVASFAAIPAASAEEVTCENANFSTEVMEQFAGVRYSCVEIVERNGKPHAKLNAVVVRVSPPNLTVKFEREGGLTNPVTLTPGTDYSFTVDDGREVPLRELTASSELRVYVPVKGPAG
jgi:hypothetical protein